MQQSIVFIGNVTATEINVTEEPFQCNLNRPVITMQQRSMAPFGEVFFRRSHAMTAKCL